MRTKSIVRIMMTITMKLLPLTPTHLSRQEKLYKRSSITILSFDRLSC
jgi:hypothetical protein